MVVAQVFFLIGGIMIWFLVAVLVLVGAFLYACCKISSLSDNVHCNNQNKVQHNKIANRKSK